VETPQVTETPQVEVQQVAPETPQAPETPATEPEAGA